MKNLILIMIIAFLINSCEEKECCVNIDVGISISVVDSIGNDLLNPENPNSFSFEGIRIYDLVDGEKDLFYNGHLDSPRNIALLDPRLDDKYRLGLIFNLTTGEYNTRFIQWDDNIEDEFKVQFYRNNGNTTILKVWLNQELVWDSDINSGIRDFTITRCDI